MCRPRRLIRQIIGQHAHHYERIEFGFQHC
jgi:hypothetical protein